MNGPELLFWLSFGVLAFTYFGYPIALALIAPFRHKPIVQAEAFEPTLSVIVALHNGARHVEAKVRNCGELDYPPDRMEILIVDDASQDASAELAQNAVERYLRAGSDKEAYAAVRVLRQDAHQGKWAALNRGSDEAKGDILVFTDVDCQVARGSLRLLVRPFANPIVGCVAGRYLAGGVRGRNAGGVGFYWRYENFLRTKESEIGGLLGASGSLYAVRRNLYCNLHPGLINDDFVVPMRTALQGYRTLYEPRAIAVEDESRNSEIEFSRRVRIMTGNCQHLWEFRHLVSASRTRLRPLLQMFCHKFLRVVSPLWLIAFAVANAILVFIPASEQAPEPALPYGFYCAILAAQALFYCAAAVGKRLLGSSRPSRLATLPYYFTMLNAAALCGMYMFFFRRASVAWGARESS